MIVIHTEIESPGSVTSSAQAARVFRAGRKFTHLMADSEEELRAYARKQRIPVAWIQYAGTVRVHFDITGAILKRVQADPAVTKMTLREWVDWRKKIEGR